MKVMRKSFLVLIALFFVLGTSLPASLAYGDSSASPLNGNPTNPSTASPLNGTGNAATQQPAGQPLNIHLTNPLAGSGVTDIPSAVNKILTVVIKIALPLIIIMFIWSGITFIFARGNPKKLEDAKRMFLYTIIGTLLILGAWTITNALIGTVNSIITP